MKRLVFIIVLVIMTVPLQAAADYDEEVIFDDTFYDYADFELQPDEYFYYEVPFWVPEHSDCGNREHGGVGHDYNIPIETTLLNLTMRIVSVLNGTWPEIGWPNVPTNDSMRVRGQGVIGFDMEMVAGDNLTLIVNKTFEIEYLDEIGYLEDNHSLEICADIIFGRPEPWNLPQWDVLFVEIEVEIDWQSTWAFWDWYCGGNGGDLWGDTDFVMSYDWLSTFVLSYWSLPIMIPLVLLYEKRRSSNRPVKIGKYAVQSAS
jgi:hypothetical protein